MRASYPESDMLKKRVFIISILLVFIFLQCGSDPSVEIKYIITADMRNFTGDNIDYFRGACEAIAKIGAGDFMISPGDIDPPDQVYATIKNYIGQNYLWYPVVGNHEAETVTDMQWLRAFNTNGDSLSNIVNKGPSGSVETMYSFDYKNVHFVVLNEYYDGTNDWTTDGNINDPVFTWLTNDLKKNIKPIIFVIGHEPAFPSPDDETGRIRHETDSLNQYPVERDRFWSALKEYNVKAYICGHTHNLSVIKTNGIWQIDAGHARGTGDTGARSGFITISILSDSRVVYRVYRLDLGSTSYSETRNGILD